MNSPSLKGKIFYDPNTERGVYFAYDVEEIVRKMIKHSFQRGVDEGLSKTNVSSDIKAMWKKESTGLEQQLLKELGL